MKIDKYFHLWADKNTVHFDEVAPFENKQKGKWIDNSEDGYVECPFCHEATNCDDNIDELHYCWSCGAELSVGMRGEQE